MGNFCPSCLTENADGALICAICGGDMRLRNRQHQLPVMTILDGRYLIGKVIGEGGFGITYVGKDLRLNEKVAIKEFYPAGNVTRYSEHSLRVEATSADTEIVLKREREKFLTEARTMSRFNKDTNIVHVKDFFYENDTSYIVMEYIDGETLSARLKREGPQKDFTELYHQLRPMMQALDDVHKNGLIHRDISPSNLMLDKNGEVKLLDFGTARETNEDGEKSLSVVLKPGFAPEEQYRRRGKQGPWTDVYALCATMYRLCTGVTPEISVDRLLEDTLEAPSALGVKINKTQETVLMHGLAVHQEERIQSVAELIEAFDKAEIDGKIKPKKDLEEDPKKEPIKKPKKVPEKDPEKDPEKELKEDPKKDPEKDVKKDMRNDAGMGEGKAITPKRKTPVWLIAAALCLCAVAVFFVVKFSNGNPNSADSHETIQVGDYITFGSYEQDNDTSNGKEDIEWLVLDKKGNKILAISKYGLDAKLYNEEYASVTWEDCTIRSWLNGEFYNAAFSDDDKQAIIQTAVSADKNPKYSTDPGNDTTDNVFLLSINEANKYFSSDSARQCAPTDYAIAQGAYTNSKFVVNGKSSCRWWLRSPGSNQLYAAGVLRDGLAYHYGCSVDDDGGCVRPALWINLEADAVRADGEDSAESGAKELKSPQIGDYITFGSYEQDNDTSNGAEKIEWLVLDKQDDKMLVISRYGLDMKRYNDAYAFVTWEKCTLRSWLNNNFYNDAFSDEEKQCIVMTNVSADKNPNYDTDPGNDTTDNVFVLSVTEAEKYFSSDTARDCNATEYAIAHRASTSPYYKEDVRCYWWLRSPGSSREWASNVYSGGGIGDSRVESVGDCVRPAMWIKLDEEQTNSSSG